jgi:hypothetical protein
MREQKKGEKNEWRLGLKPKAGPPYAPQHSPPFSRSSHLKHVGPAAQSHIARADCLTGLRVTRGWPGLSVLSPSFAQPNPSPSHGRCVIRTSALESVGMGSPVRAWDINLAFRVVGNLIQAISERH